MKLATSSMISAIDEYSSTELGIDVLELMHRSGDAVVQAVRARAPKDKEIIFLNGKGNNGGDGYAAACKLMDEYKVTVYDIFSSGQRSDAGKHFLEKYLQKGGKIIPYTPTAQTTAHIKSAGCIVDAVFGTGFQGEMPEEIRPLAIAIREAVGARKIAIDVPLGINADNGSISDFAVTVGTTVELSYIKPGIVSYPARAYVGEIVYDDLGLPFDKISSAFDFKYNTIDAAWVRDNLPHRENNSNKGTFGKLLVITGSDKYRGAAHLSLEAALRGGVGLVTFLGDSKLCSDLSAKYPEVIYKSKAVNDELSDDDIAEIIALSSSHSATLVGSGSGNTEGLLRLVLALMKSEGGPLILDADAINALATIGAAGVTALKNSVRKIVLTPHPLEFARLSDTDVASVQLHRLEAAEKFAKENKITIVLKGAGTIITDGQEVYVNIAGSSALAKAGSGDVLAGLLGALVAQGNTSVIVSSALAVYYHAIAGENLAKEFSSFGVTPSDLPREIARSLAKTEKEKNKSV